MGIPDADTLAKSVHTFRGFDVCDIWICLCILMGLFISTCVAYAFRLWGQHLESQKGWREIRTKHIEAETAQTGVMRQSIQEEINTRAAHAQEFASLRAEVSSMKALLTDYLIGGK